MDPTPPIYRIGDLTVDVGRVRVSRGESEIALPKLSFDFLVALAEIAPSVASIDALMQRVWPGLVVSPETVSQRVKLLREAIGDDSREPRYIQGVRARGYRLVPEVSLVGAAPPPGRSTSRAVSKPVAVAAIALLAAVAGLVAMWRGGAGPAAPDSGDSTPSPPARSVAVLPFENLNRAVDGNVLALGIAESVLHQLANLPELTVIARTSSFAFEGRNQDVRDIGRKLHARYLLEGSVQSDRERLRVTAQLVDSRTGGHVWSMQFDRRLQDVFAVQDEIALEVAKALELSLDPAAAEKLKSRGNSNFDAYLAFLQGRALLATWRVADMRAAIGPLAQAVRLDPAFSSAQVALAGAQLRLAEFDVADDRRARFAAVLAESEAAIERALASDPSNGDAYLERAYVRAFSDLAGAEADYRRGLQLSPNDARGYEGLAAVLFQGFTRRRDALALIDRARRVDPLEPRHDVTKAVFLLYGHGDATQARAVLEDVLARHPLYQPALARMSELLMVFRGEIANGIRFGEQALALDPLSDQSRRLLMNAYLSLDDLPAATAVMREAGAPAAASLIWIHLYRRDWLRAGNAAYQAAEADTISPITEGAAALAIRLHARATGELPRARAELERLSEVSFDQQEEERPDAQSRYSLKYFAVGLADLLNATGRPKDARRILESVLLDIDVEARELGRGDLWYSMPEAIALALLGRKDESLTALERAVSRSYLADDWWFHLHLEPAFDPIRAEPRFRAMLAQADALLARERALLVKLRAGGLVARRGTPSQASNQR